MHDESGSGMPMDLVRGMDTVETRVRLVNTEVILCMDGVVRDTGARRRAPKLP